MDARGDIHGASVRTRRRPRVSELAPGAGSVTRRRRDCRGWVPWPNLRGRRRGEIDGRTWTIPVHNKLTGVAEAFSAKLVRNSRVYDGVGWGGRQRGEVGGRRFGGRQGGVVVEGDREGETEGEGGRNGGMVKEGDREGEVRGRERREREGRNRKEW